MKTRHFVLQAFFVVVALPSLYGGDPPDFPAAFTKSLEQRWSLEAIRKFCIPERRHDEAYQNLVAMAETWEGQLYSEKKTGFDKIFWYATVKSGRVTTYSLNVSRGDDFWLLEIVDRDQMDRPPIVEPDASNPGFVGHK
jgi:hypothetical protein